MLFSPDGASPNLSGTARERLDLASPEFIARKKEIASWLDRVRASDRFSVEPSTLDRSDAWSHTQGTIRHETGRFFTIVGLTWNDGPLRRWQPFMEQREIGTLGFIARHGEDGIELLVHAKTEPGNVGIVQLAPTCQATASNSDRIHGGAAPPYSDYFSGAMGEVISDSRQSEDGTRFFGKLNRNILIMDDHIAVEDEQHCWIPFKFFRLLLNEDFLVNTDARSVLCTTDWARLAGGLPFQGDDSFSRELNASFGAPIRREVLERINVALQGLRTRAPTVEVCALERMPGWRFDAADPITMTDGHLSIRHIQVHAATREVTDWDQPIFQNDFAPTIDLECGRTDGALQFGFRPCWEPGLLAGAELAPTRVASVAGNAFPGEARLTVRQSNEGGRFFRDIANYRILDIGAARPEDNLIWLTLAEVHALLPRGFFNIEARSALSLLLSLA